MKYCCSRPIFGISYGCITLSIYGIGIFVSILLLVNNTGCSSITGNEAKPWILALLIVNLFFSSTMYIVTALLIASIIKKLPKLLVPWMVVSIVNLLASSGFTLYLFLTPQHHYWMGIIGTIFVGVQALILCIIYVLYNDLKKEYIVIATEPERVAMRTPRNKDASMVTV